ILHTPPGRFESTQDDRQSLMGTMPLHLRRDDGAPPFGGQPPATTAAERVRNEAAFRAHHAAFLGRSSEYPSAEPQSGFARHVGVSTMKPASNWRAMCLRGRPHG